MKIEDREPKLVVTITASDYFGAIEARREVRILLIGHRDELAKAASDAASHASDLIDAHLAVIDRTFGRSTAA